MDRQRPVLGWCRSKQVGAGPVPTTGSVSVGAGWCRSGPVGAGAGWPPSADRCRCRGETARNAVYEIIIHFKSNKILFKKSFNIFPFFPKAPSYNVEKAFISSFYTICLK